MINVRQLKYIGILKYTMYTQKKKEKVKLDSVFLTCTDKLLVCVKNVYCLAKHKLDCHQGRT